jgi:hypothetical protein
MNKKLILALGAVSGLLFFILVGIRMDLFRPVPPPGSGFAVSSLSEKTNWMAIFQKDRKIGYSQRKFRPDEKGYTLTENTFMRINTMGMVQDINIMTTGNLNPDLTLSGFDFFLQSSLFGFHARGTVEGQKLVIESKGNRMEIPLEQDIYLTSGLFDAVSLAGLEKGQIREFNIFDPATMGQRPVKVTMVGYETIDVLGQPLESAKLTLDVMGSQQTAWISKEGEVVREEGIMGIHMVKSTAEHAMTNLSTGPGEDLTQQVSVRSNIAIENREIRPLLKMKITGIPENMDLNGGRQSLKDDILTIRRETLPAKKVLPLAKAKQYLVATPFIQSDHLRITDMVPKIVSTDETPSQKAEKLVRWVYENIEKRPVLSIPNALDVLENRMGDCNEHAVLLAALARAAGIPARIEAGLVYMRGRFFYHAWNSLYLEGWITADALMNQMPADVTHIRIVQGGPEAQIDLMAIIGKVNLEILEQDR